LPIDPFPSEAELFTAGDVISDAANRIEAEEALRATFQHAALGMIHLAPDGRFIRINDRFCEMLGYGRGELLQRTLAQITHPNDVEASRALLRRCLAGEIETFGMEKRYLKKSGTPLWAHLTVSLARNPQGRPHYLIGVVQDITSRRQADEALRESERRLSLALEAGNLGLWELDLKNGTLEASERCKAHYGRSPEDEITPEIVMRSVHPEDRGRRARALAQAIDARGEYHCEYRILWPDGSIHWLNARGHVVCGEDGAPRRMVGVLFDTTAEKRVAAELRRLNDTLEERVRERTQQLRSEVEERERAQQAERDSEARYAAVFQHTTAGIILLNVAEDGRFVYEAVNPRHERLTGMPAGYFVGRTSYDLFPPALADRLIARYRRCLESGAPLTYEDDFPYPAGHRSLQATVVPVRDADGAIKKLLVSTHDLTERKQAEEAMRQAQKMEAVGQLTGGVAHDFNNLLTAVLGNLELLSHRTTDPGQRRLVDGALRAAERGAKLTQQLLAFARRQRLEPKPVEVNRLIAGMSEMLLSTIGATVRIETVLSDGLWPAMLDLNQVELILLNLAINARDAMPGGGVLTIKAENLRLAAPDSRLELAAGEYVVLSVADTGAGMSEEVRARAFEPFFTTKEVGKGSGLGLSQVYGIARQLGGSVDITSQPQAGTLVRVYLPRAQTAAVPSGCALESAPLGAPRRERILVVDDDRDVREFVLSCLTNFGYRVTHASEGRAALKLIEREAIDLLLADYAMPEMNGAELAREARRLRPRLKVLFMTGYAQAAPLEGEIDGTPVLRKPFKLAGLAAALRAAIGEAGPQDSALQPSAPG
jgi:PAS domain S-box-containing protein